MYRHLDAGWVLRLTDGAHIPPEPTNRDWVEFLAWEAEGGVTNPYIPPVPSKLTPRQFKQGLTRIGMRAAVEATVAAADQDTKDWYFESTSFERANPVMNAMALALGKTPEDIDNLFRLMESK
jgi:hypothetical protein